MFTFGGPLSLLAGCPLEAPPGRQLILLLGCGGGGGGGIQVSCTTASATLLPMNLSSRLGEALSAAKSVFELHRKLRRRRRRHRYWSSNCSQSHHLLLRSTPDREASTAGKFQTLAGSKRHFGLRAEGRASCRVPAPRVSTKHRPAPARDQTTHRRHPQEARPTRT